VRHSEWSEQAKALDARSRIRPGVLVKLERLVEAGEVPGGVDLAAVVQELCRDYRSGDPHDLSRA